MSFMPTYQKMSSPKRTTEEVLSFTTGLNTYQDQSVIKETELSDAKNILYSIDGLSPRPGTAMLANTAAGERVYGMKGYYSSSGDQLLSIADGKLKKYNSGSWSDIGSTVFADAMTDMLQAGSTMYFFNGSDNLRSYDGSTVTTYTELSAPTGLSVTATGSTGSTDYSYSVTACNNQGESTPCTAVSISNGNETLSSSNYNALSWTAVSGAVSYVIYGNTATGLGRTKMAIVYTNSYTDTGADTPSIVTLEPEGNTTGGIKGRYACFSNSRIFVAGNPDYPSRLFWGGVLDNVDNFSGDINGGGSTPIFENDGSIITAIVPFQGGVIVGKDNAIFKFSFESDGTPSLEEITRSFGIASHYACLAVENDIIFPSLNDGRLVFYSVGNQENYAASVLRTNSLSVKITESLDDVALEYATNAVAFYYNNIYGCAIPQKGETTNTRIWCLDTRFGAWSYWDGLNPSVITPFISGSEDTLYMGDSTDGNVYSMFEDTRTDNGTAISVRFSTKTFIADKFAVTKRWFNPIFQFKDVTYAGTVDGSIVLDGAITNKEFSINNLTTDGIGIGASLVGALLVGDASGGTPASGEPFDVPAEVEDTFESRGIKYTFESSDENLSYKFLSLTHDYQFLRTQLNQRYKNY